jgi:hypothetical protein
MLHGSLFISDLRIRWIREMTSPAGAGQGTIPLVVQLLGKADNVVHEDDSDDIKTLPTGVQLSFPRATHHDILRITGVDEAEPGQRYDVLRTAILDDLDTHRGPELEDDEKDAVAVVFALHGIRSGSGAWPERLRAVLDGQAVEARHTPMRVVTPSYGRMSAFNFAFTATRRKNLRWFRDQYTYYLARHRGKPLHFVGHSNGTYILGQTLRELPSMEFDRVYLAGSVLPKEFDWRDIAERQNRVERVINVCATRDAPVAFLCRILRWFGMRDVGVGGYEGFGTFPESGAQIRSIDGDHGAALDSAEDLNLVATYLRGDDGHVATRYHQQVEASNISPEGARASERFGQLSRLAPFLAWAILIAFVVAVIWSAAALSSIVPVVIAAILLVVGYVTAKVA